MFDIFDYGNKKDVQDPDQFPYKLRVVVTGAPRGGTYFISDVLKNLLNVKVGHERVFSSSGCHSQPDEVDVSGFAWPYLPELFETNVKIVHLIRDPLKSADSMTRFFPSLNGDWGAALRLWYKWHRMNATYADMTMRLEDPVPGLLYVMGMLGSTSTFKDLERAFEKAERGSKGKGIPFIRCGPGIPQEIREFALGYGYDI